VALMNHKIDQSKRNKRPYATYAWIFIGVLLAAGLFFRFYNLEKKAYWFDETFTSLYISGYTPAEVKQRVGDREISAQELMRFQHVNPDRGLLSTVTALSVNDPHHSPLYYGLARLWAGLFGDSVWVIRSLSAFASLLVFPCLYWLCRELFEMRRVAWVALMIVAVSPFHVLYAQEARQYSLWTVTILLSSAALLWALRLQMKRGWALYAVTVTIGMYTHVLFGLVIIAHGVYMIGHQSAQTDWNLRQLAKALVAYLTATLSALAAFMPWVYVMVTNFSMASSQMSWVRGSVNPFHLIGMWAHNVSAVFLDTNHTLKSVVPYDFATLISYGIRFFILIVAAYSVYFLYSQTPRRTWLFVLALIVMPMLTLAVPDFLLGGARSGWAPKYLLPCYLGIQLAFAHLLATKMTAASPLRRRGWQAVTALVIVCGVVSCAISSQAESWWMKPTLGKSQGARIVNECGRPLLIIDVFSMYGSGHLLCFGHLLHPKVRLWVAVKPETLQVRDSFSDVFVFDPGLLLRQRLEQEEGFRIGVVETAGKLWRVTKKPQYPQNFSGYLSMETLPPPHDRDIVP
jgi:uncharacterized membrane protein